MAYAKINNITNANMGKVNNAAKAAIGKIANIDAPTASDDAFTFTMNTENAGSATKTFVLPLVNDGSLNFTVDWGDSSSDTITAYNDPETTHIYSSTGTYTIKMTGTIRGWDFASGGDKLKILNISQWGDFNITQQGIFMGCANLTSNATDAPTIGTTDLTQTFNGCTALNGGLAGWDVSSVTSMYSMFFGCAALDADLSSWDVGEVTNMYQMFSGANAFNNTSLNNWDVKLSDIAITLTKPTAVTTAVVNNSTSVPIDNGDGIMDDVSTVSGIGIDPSVVDPTVTTIGSYSGTTATLTLSAAQTLESGITLTFTGAGQTATITGNIEIIEAGTADTNLRFDVEKLLSIT